MVEKPKRKTTGSDAALWLALSMMSLAAAGAGIDLGRAVLWLPASVTAVLAGLMFLVCMFNLAMRKDEP